MIAERAQSGKPAALHRRTAKKTATAGLESKPSREILRLISQQDRLVAPAVARVIPQIAKAVDLVVPALRAGGRLIYIGAGTSGRLGVLDAAECLPTFGTEQIVGVLAGGPRAMFKAAEGAEDKSHLAVSDLKKIKLSRRDVLAGISASGRTPYTLAALRYARRLGALTIGISCDPEAPIRRCVDVALIPVVGPEIITGSTRMKAGTAQKLVLNMLSTACMARLGRVLGTAMIGVQPTNKKLQARAEMIVMKTAKLTRARSALLLRQAQGNLPAALLMAVKGYSRVNALEKVRSGANVAQMLGKEGLLD